MGTIRLELSEELLGMVNEGKTVTFQVAGPKSAAAMREDSLPSRIVRWAAKRKRFSITEVEKAFKVSRAHASMLLSRLASGRYEIVRLERGVYAHKERVEEKVA